MQIFLHRDYSYGDSSGIEPDSHLIRPDSYRDAGTNFAANVKAITAIFKK
jgi:hypothetical protein